MKLQSRSAITEIIKEEMPYLREHFGVESLALFGSFAHEGAHEASDVDLVVSLSKPLGFSFFSLAHYLEQKLGRKVDLITTKTLELGMADPRRRYIAREIQESLIDI